MLWLFGLQLTDDFELSQRDFGAEQGGDLNLAARYILEELGIEPEETEPDALSRLIDKFGGTFPGTAKFSEFARRTLPGIEPREDPDRALVAWMEHEEALTCSPEM